MKNSKEFLRPGALELSSLSSARSARSAEIEQRVRNAAFSNSFSGKKARRTYQKLQLRADLHETIVVSCSSWKSSAQLTAAAYIFYMVYVVDINSHWVAAVVSVALVVSVAVVKLLF